MSATLRSHLVSWLAGLCLCVAAIPAALAQEPPDAALNGASAVDPAGDRTGTPAPAEPDSETDKGWPREIKSGAVSLLIYQPQVDSWDGHRLEAHAAVAVKTEGNDNRTYGVAWISAATDVNKDQRTVSLEEFRISKVNFPSAPDQADAWADVLRRGTAGQTQVIALDRLEADLAVASAGRKSAALPVKNEPPRILFSTEPALLILIDGAPVYRPVAGTELKRILNTRPLVLEDAAGRHYLKIYDGWMAAPALQGPWTPTLTPPPGSEQALQKAVDSKTVDLLQGGGTDQPDSKPSLAQGPVPKIFVATTPTELIVTDGEMKWVPVTGTNLLYVGNTTAHIFKDLDDQQTYVLVSGRWFRALSNDGPWQFVAQGDLPDDFAKIPDDSPKENVKASVSGTPQAEEALIANSIPQTAKVSKQDAKLDPPAYDGTPKLAPIQGTSLLYVVNTQTPIIAVGSPAQYYAVQNGVWFVSGSLYGPWVVAATVPAVIYTIPPSSPVHYVTYVQIYDATPDYVWVGYTPGYYGAYVYDGVVVYGTGYYYTPWVGTVWYGPPVTYGYGVCIAYTPWTGWYCGYGFGWGRVWWPAPWWGPIGWGWHAYYPWVYRPGYGVAWGPHGGCVVWGRGGWAATTGNVYHQWGSTTAITRQTAGFNAWTGNTWSTSAGRAYNSRTGTLAAGQRGSVYNAYTGNYASGERGVVHGGQTGITAAGERGTIGNVETGREVSGGRGVVYNPNTGQVTRIGGVSGDQGSVFHVGDDVYATHDGHIYSRDDDGWVEHDRDTNTRITDPDRTQMLDREQSARSLGQQRWDNYRAGGGYGGGGLSGGGFGGGGGFRGGGGRRR